MANRPKFTVIEGGTGQQGSATYIPSGLLNDRGETLYRPGGTDGSSGGGPGDGEMRSRVTLEQNVKGLNWVVSILIAAFAGAFLFFLLRIDDRFDRVDEPVRQVQQSLAAQSEALRAINDRIGDLRSEIQPNANQPEGSSRSGQAGSVRERAREGR
jgi:hypothetical protein